jgi:RNA polymerase sigma factor (sigma-70 family)
MTTTRQVPDPDPRWEAAELDDAFNVFFKTNIRMLRGYLRSQGCISEADVDDVTQESFLVLRRKWGKVRHESPRAYLYTVALHLAQRLANISSRTVPMRLQNLKWLAERVPVDEFLLVESHSDCLALLRKLPRRQAEVVCLRALLEFSEAETAQILGLGRETVKSHYRIARVSLGMKLNRHRSGGASA